MSDVETWLYDEDGIPYLPISPGAELDYPFNFLKWLNGDTIVSQTVVCSDPAALLSSNLAGAVVTSWVRGTTVGATLTLSCSVVTAGARKDTRVGRLKVQVR